MTTCTEVSGMYLSAEIWSAIDDSLATDDAQRELAWDALSDLPDDGEVEDA